MLLKKILYCVKKSLAHLKRNKNRLERDHFGLEMIPILNYNLKIGDKIMDLKKCLLGIGICTMSISLMGVKGKEEWPDTLSNDYITVADYLGVEIERKEIVEATEEDVDKVVRYVLSEYARKKELDNKDLELTDEIVLEVSQEATTVDEYRLELKNMINDTKKNSLIEKEREMVWGIVVDNSTVKEFPHERLERELDNLKDLYLAYANMEGMTYEEYLEMMSMTEDTLLEMAESSMKQILIAEIISEYYHLTPTEEETMEQMQAYIDKYKLTNIDVLKATLPEEDLNNLILRNKVENWLLEQCTYVEG